MFEEDISQPRACHAAVQAGRLTRLQTWHSVTHLCMHAEDREDLKVFEEGISQPKASHAAWTAAASSLQMRNALPEVRPVMFPEALGSLIQKTYNRAKGQQLHCRMAHSCVRTCGHSTQRFLYSQMLQQPRHCFLTTASFSACPLPFPPFVYGLRQIYR